MATIATLEMQGKLIPIEVPLDRGEKAWRVLYGTPDFIAWLDNKLVTLKTTIIGCEIEPIEQVDAVFHEYVSGLYMPPDSRFKKLSCTPDQFVWEFKTLDVRIFGWVPRKDHFICTFGDAKDTIELMRSYGTYIAKTVYVRTQMGLQPTHIASAEYHDVLSNAH
ncbi:hypothetical protein [Kumtagia ephedrae]|uniref:hypothetical protein n=1 Tax=Kumtagia ephedrae TaxID=2116701 RepID=UPI0010572DA4|nr:hypothetical protein [Mesorhizobium ephedrae]